jgi:thioredoxin-related protein
MNKVLAIAILVLMILPTVAGNTAKAHPFESSSGYIYWMSFGEALNYARENDKLIFVYVYTDWCPQCKKLDAITFNDETVQYYLSQKFICTKVNAESDREHECNGQVYTERQIAQMLEVEGYPTIIVLASRGGSLGSFSGYREPSQLQDVLVYFSDGYFREMPFDKWMRSRY